MSKRTTLHENQRLMLSWRGFRSNPGTGALADPFAENPIRRSFLLVATCTTVILTPWFFGATAVSFVMLSVGSLAVTGIAMGLPVLLWSVSEALIRMVRERMCPTVAELEISPR